MKMFCFCCCRDIFGILLTIFAINLTITIEYCLVLSSQHFLFSFIPHVQCRSWMFRTIYIDKKIFSFIFLFIQNRIMLSEWWFYFRISLGALNVSFSLSKQKYFRIRKTFVIPSIYIGKHFTNMFSGIRNAFSNIPC